MLHLHSTRDTSDPRINVGGPDQTLSRPRFCTQTCAVAGLQRKWVAPPRGRTRGLHANVSLPCSAFPFLVIHVRTRSAQRS